MNPPHTQLQAFLTIARYDGIAKASQRTGQSRSNLSTQLTELEDMLHSKLCTRRVPFTLNRHGRILIRDYEASQRLISTCLDEIVREACPMMTVAAAEAVTHHYLTDIIHRVEEQHPNLRCATESGTEQQLVEELRAGDVDLVIAPEDSRWRGCSGENLATIAFALMCPKASPVKSAGELWARGKIDVPLFHSRSAESVTRRFDAHLGALKVEWDDRRAVSSAMSVRKSVAAGHGFGLTLNLPALVQERGIRILPLPHLEPMPIAVYWRGAATAFHRTAIKLLRDVARAL